MTAYNSPVPVISGERLLKKIITVVAVCLVVIIAVAIALPKVAQNKIASTRITTYNVDAISYGNVTRTISGSGTLTPVTTETVTSSTSGEVEEVNFTVGDEVAEDDVLAVIDGDDVTELEPPQRQVNTIFQNYALFPLMTIEDNVAFGLKMKNVPKDEIKQ